MTKSGGCAENCDCGRPELSQWELSSKPAVAAVTSPVMTVLTQQIISPRLSLINNNNNHIQVGGGVEAVVCLVSCYNTFVYFRVEQPN